MPKINLAKVPQVTGSRYPAPFATPCLGRIGLRLGDAAGLTQFGVNHVRLPPGVWSSQRHWHSHEDEFVYVLSGEVVLVTDAGDETLRAGDSVGFKAGVRDGHCLQNRSPHDVVLLVVGSRDDSFGMTRVETVCNTGEYPDIDMKFDAGRYSGQGGFRHRDGTPY
jgi:uncharacterized cupin superfamily protein